MTIAALKERLHEYIEQADDKHLEAIYVLIEKEIPSNQYDATTLDELHQRRNNYVKGISKSYTVDEAISSIRNAGKK